jgi:Na+/alanine symporter
MTTIDDHSKLNTFSKFFTKVNDKVFIDNKEGTDFKEEVKTYLKICLIICLAIFFIFFLTTSILTIQYYNEICSNNISLKQNMDIIYNLAICNIAFLFIFIILCGIQYYDKIELFKNMIFVYLLIIFFISIIFLNMYISYNLIYNISRCDFRTYNLYNYLWINYAITLPISLLILIFYIIHSKIK